MTYALLGIALQRLVLALNNSMALNYNFIQKNLLIITIVCFIVGAVFFNGKIIKLGAGIFVVMLCIKIVTSKLGLYSTIIGFGIAIFLIVTIKRRILARKDEEKTTLEKIIFYLL